MVLFLRPIHLTPRRKKMIIVVHTNTQSQQHSQAHTHTLKHTHSHTQKLKSMKTLLEMEYLNIPTYINIRQFSGMCCIYQYLVGNGIVITIVQVQRGEYQQLTGCFKQCNCKTQIYTRNKGRISKERNASG